MLAKMMNDMAHEFGLLNESDANIEASVINKLQQSAKLDEVDTITFGLETDDGKIVKVYINAEQADEFEKALAAKLGETDNIGDALNELAKKFDIVDVDWPDEPAQPTDVDDGSEVLDPEVYKNAKETAEVEDELNNQTVEGVARVGEASESFFNIESRFTTATQLLIYHAVLELGIPEDALNRSAHRVAIVRGIKNKADQLLRNSSAKNSLRYFVNKSIDFEDKAKRNAANEAVNGENILSEADQSAFWHAISDLVTYIAGDQKLAVKFLESPGFKSLKSRSLSAVRLVPSTLMTKLTSLATSVKPGVSEGLTTESISAQGLTDIITALLTLADPNGEHVSALMNSSAWRAIEINARPTLSQKFTGTSGYKVNQLLNAIKSFQANLTTEDIEVEEPTWSFKEVGKRLKLVHTDGGDVKVMTVSRESGESLIKAMMAKQTITIDDVKPAFIFSPRGPAANVNLVAGRSELAMFPKDVKALKRALSNFLQVEDDE